MEDHGQRLRADTYLHRMFTDPLKDLAPFTLLAQMDSDIVNAFGFPAPTGAPWTQ